MVMITPEEVMAQRKGQMPSDIMPEWKRELVGESVRLDIPMDSAYLLRKVGPIVAGLAEHIKFTAQRTDIPEYDILMSIRNEVRAAAKQIRTLHGGALKNGSYPRKK